MRHRTFTDRTGTRWTVSEVTKGPPTFADDRERRRAPRSKNRSADKLRFDTRPLGLPWLSFESAVERRTLAAIPNHWDELPDDELEDLLARSVVSAE